MPRWGASLYNDGMEFRRAEIRKVYRHKEEVVSPEEMRAIFEAIRGNNLKFSARIDGLCSELHDCAVSDIADDHVEFVARSPMRMRLTPKYEDIKAIEIISSKEIVAEEKDDGGRWARIINQETT